MYLFKSKLAPQFRHLFNHHQNLFLKKLKHQCSHKRDALQSAGASTAQASVYAGAKAARLEARANWDAAMATGDKAAAQAAEDAFMAARDVNK